MLRTLPLPVMVPILVCCALANAVASDYELVPLDAFASEETTVNLRAPILEDGGDAYWTARNDLEDADLLFRDPGGQIDLVADLPQSTAGEVPLFNGPTDESNGSLVLSGKLVISVGGGFQQVNAYYTWPGLDRIVDYTTPVEGFPNDPTFTVPEHPPLFDSDGSLVFLMRDGTIFSDLRYAICRLVGTTVTKLVEEDVTLMPGGAAVFTRVFAPTVDDGVILFYGEGGGRKGVYQLASGSITTVVDNQTVLPGTASPVSILAAASVVFANDGADVVIGFRENNVSVWKRVGGTWSQVAARSQQMPGGSGIFYDFVAVAIRNGIAAFSSRRDNQFLPPRDAGIYTDDGGRLHPVASFIADFPDLAPTRFQIASGGRWFDGVDVVFAVESDVEGQFYRAVPEPAPVLAFIAAGAALAIRRRLATP